MLDRSIFIEKYASELANNNAAMFIGAGLSKAAGFVDWPGLLEPVAGELGLDVKKENDLVALAQYYVNKKFDNRHQLSQLLVEKFSDLREPTENHKILARLPIGVFWTTNYDTLIEDALAASGKRADVKYTAAQLTTTKSQRDTVVYKMHGDINHPSSAILTKDDYERYHRTHEPFITALSGALVSTTFCFLGFSFNDPNLDYVLGRIRATFTKYQHTHYCVTKRRSRKEFSKKAEFDYSVVKQELVTHDFLRFNIETIFVDQYAEITDILHALEKRHRIKTVFISGSAAEYGPWGRQKTEEFIAQLGSGLVREGYRITTGFGLGVGGALVRGAVQEIYSHRAGQIEDHLTMRPFPIGITDLAERQKTFERYREDIIAQAGIAIFVLGNRLESGTLASAAGVRAEFELAKKMGLWLIPVGASGFMSEELWQEVMSDFNAHYPKAPRKLQTLMQKLAGPVSEPNDLVSVILEIVKLVSKP